jgi:hypothetical protein
MRHFAAVVLVVAVIIGLGMLWAHVSGDGTGANNVIRQAPPPAVLAQLKAHKGGGVVRMHDGATIRISSGAGLGFHFQDPNVLIQTCEIEAGIAAVIVIVGVTRRRYRRRVRRRAAVTGASAAAEG